jgi:hypothetical protein
VEEDLRGEGEGEDCKECDAELAGMLSHERFLLSLKGGGILHQVCWSGG